MRHRHGLIATLFVLLPLLQGCYTLAPVSPPMPPPSRDQVAGTWFALTSFRAHRLDLFEDGTGALVLASRLGQCETRHYKTDRWELDGHELSATFHPLDAERQPLYLRAGAYRETWTDAGLRNVSISLSSINRSRVEGTFMRESRVYEWLEIIAGTGDGDVQ